GEVTEAEQEGWPNRSIDEAQTRRTQPPPNTDEEKTRRTSTPADPSRIKAAVASARRLAGKKIRLIAAVVTLLVILGVGGNEIWVGVTAAKVAESVQTRELEQLGPSWDRYDDLSRQAYLRFATRGLRRSLTQRSAVLADRVIANYRTSLPTVREAQWQA